MKDSLREKQKEREQKVRSAQEIKSIQMEKVAGNQAVLQMMRSSEVIQCLRIAEVKTEDWYSNLPDKVKVKVEERLGNNDYASERELKSAINEVMADMHLEAMAEFIRGKKYGKAFRPRKNDLDSLGMNCWGAVIMSAFCAGLINEDQVIELNRPTNISDASKASADEDMRYFMKNNETITLNKDLRQSRDEIPKGHIIGMGLSFVDHVALSRGMEGGRQSALEFDKGHKGITTLDEMKEAHARSYEGRAVFSGPPPWFLNTD